MWEWLALYIDTYPCGSELARDGGLSVDIDSGFADAIASKLAPTGGGSRMKCPDTTKPPEGGFVDRVEA
ncbi:hypothetical protein D3C80_2095520 [compost metagenome]